MSTPPSMRDPITEARRQWRAHGWVAAADGMAAVTSVMRAQQLLLTRIDAVLRPFDLTFARFELLRLLSFTSRGQMTMLRAGRRLQVHPTSLTSLAKRLHDDGLLERTENPEDRRSVVLALTAAGAELVEEATGVLNEEVFEQVGLSPEDVATLVEVLGRFRAHHGDIPTDATPERPRPAPGETTPRGPSQGARQTPDGPPTVTP